MTAGARHPPYTLPVGPVACTRRSAISLFLLALAIALMPGAAMAAADQPIRMPPMIVSGAGTWRYAEMPGFEILSRCPDKTTRSFMEGLFRAHQMLGVFVPPGFMANYESPNVIILADGGMASEMSRRIVDLRPSLLKAAAREASLEMMPNVELYDRDRWATFALLDPKSPISESGFYVEPVHLRMLLDRRVPPLPTWAVEGIMEIYSGAYDLMLGNRARLPPIALPEKPMPLADLFTAPASVQRNRQAALFLRWSLDDSRNLSRREMLWRFIEAMTTRAPSEQIFRSIFNLSYADADQALAAYAADGATRQLVVTLRDVAPLPPTTIVDATPDQVGRLKAEWEVQAVNYVHHRFPEYLAAYEDQAGATLKTEIERGVDDPRVTALYGLYWCELESDGNALPYLVKAAAAKVARPRVYLELARIRIAEAWRNAAFNARIFSKEDMARIIDPLTAAAGMQPQLRDVYRYATEALLQALPGTLTDDQQVLLATGVRNFPVDADLMLRIARVFAHAKRNTEAILLADRAKSVSLYADERKRIQDFRDTLP